MEIAYFGLLPEFIGKGYGKALLQDAIGKAWQAGGNRVWLHTCTLDHLQALNNYLARGFKVFKKRNMMIKFPPMQSSPGKAPQVLVILIHKSCEFLLYLP